MSVSETTSRSSYNTLINSTPFVALQASATWCGPCKAISPIFAKHAANLAIPDKYAFSRFDTDNVPDVAQELGISSVPAFFFFKDGELVDSVKGTNVAQLKKLVEDFSAQAKSADTFSTNEDF